MPTKFKCWYVEYRVHPELIYIRVSKQPSTGLVAWEVSLFSFLKCTKREQLIWFVRKPKRWRLRWLYYFLVRSSCQVSQVTLNTQDVWILCTLVFFQIIAYLVVQTVKSTIIKDRVSSKILYQIPVSLSFESNLDPLALELRTREVYEK